MPDGGPRESHSGLRMATARFVPLTRVAFSVRRGDSAVLKCATASGLFQLMHYHLRQPCEAGSAGRDSGAASSGSGRMTTRSCPMRDFTSFS